MKAIGSLKRRLREFPWWWRNRVRSFAIRRAGLGCRLRTGIEPTFSEWADWSVFVDIFVEGDYDSAIRETLDAADANARVTVLDIGANVGFFTLRLLHLRRRERPRLGCNIHQFEANPQTFTNLKRRMARLVLDGEREVLGTHFGAVGRPSGSLWIVANPFHAMTAGQASDFGGTEVQFIDLETALANAPIIHLLKCDIEGGETWLIESYEALLKRTQRAVIEFHLDRCNPEDCLRRLERCGLQRRQIIASNDYISLEYFVNREATKRAAVTGA